MNTENWQTFTPGAEVWRLLALSGFAEYLKGGAGFFVARNPVEYVDDKGQVQWNLTYLPVGAKIPSYLAAAATVARRYDPCKSVVFVVYEGETSFAIRQMGAKELGVTPIEAYRAWCVKAGHGRLIPGEVLLLKKAIEGPDPVAAGLYVFLTREGAWMTLRTAGLDQNAVVQLTNDDVRVHCDYEECFSNSPGVILRLSAVGSKKKRRGKGKV